MSSRSQKKSVSLELAKNLGCFNNCLIGADNLNYVYRTSRSIVRTDLNLKFRWVSSRFVEFRQTLKKIISSQYCCKPTSPRFAKARSTSNQYLAEATIAQHLSGSWSSRRRRRAWVQQVSSFHSVLLSIFLF